MNNRTRQNRQAKHSLSPVTWINSLQRASAGRQVVTRGKKNPLYTMLSRRLVQLRAATDLSQRALGDLANVNQAAISSIERGSAVSKISTIEQIATALGVSPIWLAFGEDGHMPWRERHRRFGIESSPAPEPTPGAHPCLDLYRAMGQRLCQARESKGWSMRALGREAGCTVAAISLLEAGSSIVLLSTCEDLAKVLDVAPGWLAYGVGQGPEAV